MTKGKTYLKKRRIRRDILHHNHNRPGRRHRHRHRHRHTHFLPIVRHVLAPAVGLPAIFLLQLVPAKYVILCNGRKARK